MRGEESKINVGLSFIRYHGISHYDSLLAYHFCEFQWKEGRVLAVAIACAWATIRSQPPTRIGTIGKPFSFFLSSRFLSFLFLVLSGKFGFYFIFYV